MHVKSHLWICLLAAFPQYTCTIFSSVYSTFRTSVVYSYTVASRAASLSVIFMNALVPPLIYCPVPCPHTLPSYLTHIPCSRSLPSFLTLNPCPQSLPLFPALIPYPRSLASIPALVPSLIAYPRSLSSYPALVPYPHTLPSFLPLFPTLL